MKIEQELYMEGRGKVLVILRNNLDEPLLKKGDKITFKGETYVIQATECFKHGWLDCQANLRYGVIIKNIKKLEDSDNKIKE